MKSPHLLASFAVAATATAADLKDSSTVAREWDQTAGQLISRLPDSLDLRGQSLAANPPPFRVFAQDLPPSNDLNPLRREPLIDAPRHRAPKNLPNNTPMPEGAKPWLYGGQTYWVLPLIPSREK